MCIEHTIVGRAPAHAAHFSTDGAGVLYQSRDTRYRSAANLHGNHRVIAIENEDHGPHFRAWNVNDGHAVPAFTAVQVEAIAQICAWAHRVHGIPLVACPNSRPGSRGIAYHRQGCDGNWAGYAYSGRVSGGELWSSAYGKVCPGDHRIAQIPQIISRAQQIASGGGGAGIPEEEDDMPYTEAQLAQQAANGAVIAMRDSSQYRAAFRDLVVETLHDAVADNTAIRRELSVLPWLQHLGRTDKSMHDAISGLIATVGALSAAIESLALGQGLNPEQLKVDIQAGAERAVRSVLGELDE